MPSSRSYKTQGIVLRKTKLGEKDLIITLLDVSGSLVRAVAKGARKPGGSFAARIELFSRIDCQLAKGRNLDVLTEARFAQGSEPAAFGLEQTTCASPIAELLCNVAQEGLEHPRLFEMTAQAFSAISNAEPSAALALLAADLLKTLATAGFRPSFDTCVYCDSSVKDIADASSSAAWVIISFEDGGVVCKSCARTSNGIPVELSTVNWARALLFAKFAEIPAFDIDVNTSFAVLHFARQWARVHTGRDLRSLDFLFTSGLF